MENINTEAVQMDTEANVEKLVEMMKEIIEDRTVPKNIKKAVEEAIKELTNRDNELMVRINGCVSILDEIATDPNIPLYTRTQLWTIVSLVEKLNES